MIHPVHHIPGRLRLRVPAIKHCDRHAHAVGDVLRQTDGVLHHALSRVTGSVVVHYAPERLDPQGLLDRLRAALPAPAPGTALALLPTVAPLQPTYGGGRSLAQRLGSAVASSLTEKLIERSAAALVAALL
jgi:hypothetical protein